MSCKSALRLFPLCNAVNVTIFADDVVAAAVIIAAASPSGTGGSVHSTMSGTVGSDGKDTAGAARRPLVV